MEVVCGTCHKSFKKPRCHGVRVSRHFCSRECYRKRPFIGETHCIRCAKEIGENRKSKFFCGACYKKDYKERNPDVVLKERQRQLEKTRIKNGLPLDHPYLVARPGEGNKTKHGYRLVYKPGHPNCRNLNGSLYEHTFVMSEHLGRPLRKGESVHHKNGDKLDNRIENLELWHKGQPSGQRVEDKIEFYKEFLEQYGYKVTKE